MPDDLIRIPWQIYDLLARLCREPSQYHSLSGTMPRKPPEIKVVSEVFTMGMNHRNVWKVNVQYTSCYPDGSYQPKVQYGPLVMQPKAHHWALSMYRRSAMCVSW